MAWRVARSLLVLRDQIDALHPARSRASDGTIGDQAHQGTASDHNPDGRGIVRALDLTHDPGHGLDIDRLSDQLQAGRDSRVSYVIANKAIMFGAGGPSPWAWLDYDGDDPHTGHIHISVVADDRADQTYAWYLTDGDDMAISPEDLKMITQNVSSAILRGAWRDGYIDNTFDSGYQGGQAYSLSELRKAVDRIATQIDIDYVKLAKAIVDDLSSR